ncbi:family 1 glycosylhydrolase [Dietzia sp. ANT_WB102]|uniref:family 1 glycosylhydrolase n=1 Tax=Dietzia sp. ANT_WB102 TaxID=2597345 RepID=UPI0011EED965|nr:family 1 glycosylhydrolase [Dietzia sp. ANT_WB102]KAA0919279.1 glycoside hydrolase family 1 protein [Dietzia sp. ANT_WB102]
MSGSARWAGHPTIIRRGLSVLLALVLAVAVAPQSHPSAAARPGEPATTPGAGFHWGVATSGFQVEGSNPDSNWRRYVDAAAPTGQADPVGDAVDFWNRYEEDIANAAAMGVNTFRLSVEWARIEPAPVEYDDEALRHYDRIIDAVRRHGMTPMITMVHFVYPGWLADEGGFLGPGAVDSFGRFADLITDRWAGDGTMWVSFNEPMVFFKHETTIGRAAFTDFSRFLDNVEAAHRLGYAAAHRADPAAMVTMNEAYLPMATEFTDTLVGDRVADVVDYVGIDYYYGVALNNLTAINAAWDDFAAVRPQPEGIYEAIAHYANAYPGKPIYIVENGMPTRDGVRGDGIERGEFLRDTVFWLQRAVADGYPVIGYNHWSLVDNYEWGDYSARFGLYRVDVLGDPTLTRRPTSGVEAYRDIIAGGGVSDGYRPVLPAAWCSLATIPDSCIGAVSAEGPLAKLAG